MSGDVLLLNSDGSPMSIIPLSTVSWKEAIRLVYLDKVAPIDFYSDWVVHSARMSMVVPSIIMTKHYYENTSSVRFTKSNVLLRDQFMCQYCGEEFLGSELTLDHVHPKSMGGKKSWDNIVCACGPCNWERGDNIKIKPINKPVKPTYYNLVNNRKRYPIYLKHKSWNDYLQWNEKLVSSKPLHEEKFIFNEIKLTK